MRQNVGAADWVAERAHHTRRLRLHRLDVDDDDDDYGLDELSLGVCCPD